MRVVAQYRLVFFVSPFLLRLPVAERTLCVFACRSPTGKADQKSGRFSNGLFYVFVHFMNKMCRTYFLQTRKVHFQAQKHEKK